METVILSALRLVIGALLFFFVPGLFVSVSLFPRQASLTGLERIVTAIVISVIISVVDGAICLVTVGLTFTSLSLSMLAWSVIAIIVASMRWKTLPTADRLTIRRGENTPYILTGVAVLCLVALLTGVTALSSQPPETHYSEFYVLDSNHQTLSYPSNVSEGATATLILGITNHEANSDTYAATVKLDDATMYTFSNLELGQGQNLEQPLAIPFTASGEHQKLQFILTDSSAKRYELHLWVNVHGAS